MHRFMATCGLRSTVSMDVADIAGPSSPSKQILGDGSGKVDVDQMWEEILQQSS